MNRGRARSARGYRGRSSRSGGRTSFHYVPVEDDDQFFDKGNETSLKDQPTKVADIRVSTSLDLGIQQGDNSVIQQSLLHSHLGDAGLIARQQSSCPTPFSTTPPDSTCMFDVEQIILNAQRQAALMIGENIKEIILKTSSEHFSLLKGKIDELLNAIMNNGVDPSPLKSQVEKYMANVDRFDTMRHANSMKISPEVQSERLAIVASQLASALNVESVETKRLQSLKADLVALDAKKDMLKKELKQLSIQRERLHSLLLEIDENLDTKKSDISRLKEQQAAITQTPVLSNADTQTMKMLQEILETQRTELARLVGAGRHSTNDAFECKDGTPSDRREAPNQPTPGGISKQSEHELTLGYAYEQDWPSPGDKEGLSHMSRNQHGQNHLDTAGSSSQPSGCSSASDSTHENYPPKLTNDAFECKDGTPSNRREAPNQPTPGGISKQSEHELTLGYAYEQDWPLPGDKGLSHMGRNQHGKNHLDTAGSSSQPSGCSSASDSTHENYLPKLSDLSLKENTKCLQNESQIQMPIKYGINNMPSQNKGPQFGKSFLKNTIGTGNIEHSGHPGVVDPFDICPVKTGPSVILKSSLLSKNREKRNESKRAAEGQKGKVLRPGMVLLKSYISSGDQVKIVKKCQELGLGSGGFYQPGYRDGAKLNLKMMCLGKNWDPETSKYGDERPVDHAKPPLIPDEFYQLVKEAIQDSHALLAKEKSKVEEILPWMTPNICIVNFYTTSGRLGLHQDRDESQESLQKGLPVVSFSIGDSAEFLYSDQRDVFNADNVLLESGDILIFGGKSRHIFHGVTSIHPDTSPKVLLEETNLRPGRLNLTFRQY